MDRKGVILGYLKDNGKSSLIDILSGIGLEISSATLKRDLSELIKDKQVETEGQGKAFKYLLSPIYKMFLPVDIDDYLKGN